MEFKNIDEIPLDEILEIEMPENTVSEEGQREIQKVMRESVSYLLPDDWDWEWVVTKGGTHGVGTLPKRISNWLYKSLGVKADSEMLSRIGNIAKRHTNESSKYHIDLTHDIHWDAGDFGDFGSCYWGGYSNARLTLIKNGGFALRYWWGKEQYAPLESHWESGECSKRSHCGRSECMSYWRWIDKQLDGFTGVGRCWVGPITEDRLVVFNSYGPYQAITGARILSMMLGQSYKKVELYNTDNRGAQYINSNMGYIVGPSQSVSEIKSYALQWQRFDPRMCNNCGRNESVDGEDEFVIYRGETLCPACLRQLTACHMCGEAIPDADSAPRISVSLIRQELVCDDCLSYGVRECGLCGTEVPVISMHSVTVDSSHHSLFCGECAGRVTKCAECDRPSMTLIGNRCPECVTTQ